MIKKKNKFLINIISINTISKLIILIPFLCKAFLQKVSFCKFSPSNSRIFSVCQQSKIVFVFVSCTIFPFVIAGEILKEDQASLSIPDIEIEKGLKSNFRTTENEKKLKILKKRETANLSLKSPTGDLVTVKKTFSVNPNNPHKGILLSGKTPSVSAWDDGIVVAIDQLEGYDTVVIIQHKNSYLSIYGKLKDVFVMEGETLTKGALLGTSSIVSGVYFQVNQNGKPLNPLTFLR